jgi:hypothetical protein
MTDERWHDIVGMIKDRFSNVQEETFELPEEEGPGTSAEIEFDGPMGRMRLCRTSRPRIIDKRIQGANRVGSETSVEYRYSDSEFVHEFSAWRWNATTDEWEHLAVDADQLSRSF